MARKVGSTNRPAFYTYVTEQERKDYAKWVKSVYKNDVVLAKWYGDQLFGKAAQPISGDTDNPLFPQPLLDALFNNDGHKKGSKPVKED